MGTPIIKFDYNAMMSHTIGRRGITDAHLTGMLSRVSEAHKRVLDHMSTKDSRVKYGLEWADLHNQPDALIKDITRTAQSFRRFENVIFIGIGGSFLGLKAAQDALASPNFNDFQGARAGAPRIYFEGKNLDPVGLHTLLKNLDPLKTGIVNISKSGDTTEPAVTFEIARSWLMNSPSIQNWADHVVAITGLRGSLRNFINSEASKGRKIQTFEVFDGVGGRYSEFNVGLFHLALLDINLPSMLRAYGKMIDKCKSPNTWENPALQYANLQTIMSETFARNISVFQVFSDKLKSSAEWYVQLLAESLGKKHDLSGNIVNRGRTPVPAVGTSDLHSIQQNNVEGMHDKVVTLVGVEKFDPDIEIPSIPGSPIAYLAGKKMSEVLKTALLGTQWALMREEKPSCTFWLPELNSETWAAFLALQMMAVAYEGEIIKVNSTDQPGVESYKNYVYAMMGKPGLPEEILKEINAHPLGARESFIIV
jgi:glucose-6-phosphate isomerase